MSVFIEPPASKSRVRKAGKSIAEGTATQEDYELVDQWRSAHSYVINTFQIFLRRRIQKKLIAAEFAQRLKRRNTVIDKLKRVKPDGSPLIADVTTMQDFAGCRLIFDDISNLQEFRDYVHSTQSLSNVLHKLKHQKDKFNYIENPKFSGYRGIHDVFLHHPRPHRQGDTAAEPWTGLLVEIQYRTRVQHAWATALEISDIIDGQRTKFEFGGSKRSRFFALASELLARSKEGLTRAFPELSTAEISAEMRDLESELHILQRLGALKQFGGFENIRRHNVLNIKTDQFGDLALEVKHFSSSAHAILAANQLENDPSSVNAVYVRADNPAQLRSAYRNYFNDPTDFVELVEDCFV